MKIPLTIKQRLFLEYLRDAHKGFGYEGTIEDVLTTDKYEDCNIDYLNSIVKDFTDCRDFNRKDGFKEYGGLPTKYLK